METNQSIEILKNWENRGKEMYFDHYHFGSHTNTLSEEYRKINNKWFSNKDLESISYRTINYWDEKGYLTGEKNAGGKWRKFDFFQLIWIQVLDTLRNMGISNEVIVPAIFNSLGYIPEVSNEEKEEMLKGLSKEQEKELLSLYGNHMNFQTSFRFYVSYALFMKTPVSIKYYSNGKCDIEKGVTTKTDSNSIRKYLTKSNTSFISISLNELIEKFITDKSIETIENISILTENELELLKHLRRKEVSEINVYLDEGEPFKLDIKDSIENEELNKRVYEYLLSPYQKIEFKTNGGKTAYFERTTTIKLKKNK